MLLFVVHDGCLCTAAVEPEDGQLVFLDRSAALSVRDGCLLSLGGREWRAQLRADGSLRLSVS